MKTTAATFTCLWLAMPLITCAQDVEGAAPRQAGPGEPEQSLPEITVSTPRGVAPPFEVAGSVDRVEGADMRDARMQVQLSESLGAVPGLQVRDRYNLAQDLQLSIRGFGARSTFGVRGVRLYVDGIPATLPDGQGQTSNIDIGSLDHIEILRGPFSALYGNASGGVVQAFTEDGEGPPQLGFSLAAGSAGTSRLGARASGSEGPLSYLLSASRYDTDGWRAHSAARRDIANAKLGLALEDGHRLTLVANRVRVEAQDPLGLTAGQYALNPRGADLAEQFDTRKSVEQAQVGLLYERRIDADHTLRLMLYGGRRETVQFQSIPPVAQANPSHAGGVIDLGRTYGGVDLRWQGRMQLAGRPLELAAGLAYDGLREQRRGYENFLGAAGAPLALGVRGRLRRDERNAVRSLDPYVQGTWQLAERWTLEAGVRRSTVRFDSRDRYVTPANGDDSGDARYARTLPVASLRWEPVRDLALYVSAGRGFETPTLNELSYREDGLGGLNFGLRPSVNDSVEAGAKARLGGGLLTAAVFRTRTRDEIVTGVNTGGRSTFRNAGRTKRDGFELAWRHESASHWRTELAYTWLDARYRDGFCAAPPCGAGEEIVGNRLPGIARQALFASVAWVPPEGWRAGAQVHALGRVEANDANTAAAPGHAVVALHAGYRKRWAGWELDAFARVDNVFDRRYVGSLIVNEGNARYFEPAPGRNWTVGMGGTYRF